MCQEIWIKFWKFGLDGKLEFLNPRVTEHSLPMTSKEMERNFGQKLLKLYFWVDKD